MRAPWLVVLPVVPLLAAGCFQAILQPTGSTLAFTCALMDPVQDDAIVVESWTDPRIALDVTPWAARLLPVLANATGRDPGAFSLAAKAGPAPPSAGWNRTALAGAAAADYLRSRTVTLRVLWVESMADEATGMVAAPGTVVVALDSVQAAALRIGHAVPDVAFAVLLHQVGHAMGETNQGVPVQDPDIQEREGPPGHDKDPASVLNAAWDDARTVMWSDNSTYDRFAAPDLADWAGARAPGGVCT